MVASFVLAAIAYILSLVGLINASKDEGAFKAALFAVIISLIAAIVMGIFSSNATIQGIGQAIQNLMSIFVTIFVINGIISLAGQLNRDDVSLKGRNLLTIIIVVYVLALIASILSIVFGGMFVSVTAGIIALVAYILDAVGYILYLVLLSKAKNMLAE